MARTVSPGAALLRQSRLFSLPKQLPPISQEVLTANRRRSDTATTSYPTLQSITAPKIFRKHGDWGLKRALPGRASRASRPVVRINQLDAEEQVTDYSPANNHTATLYKWQELNVPITLQTDVEQRSCIAGKSVFEEDADVINLPREKKHTPEDKRWKFEGPWLAGITEGAFQEYLEKKVRPRRSQFLHFLRKQLAEDLNKTRAAKALERGAKKTPKPILPENITSEQLTDYIRQLRFDRLVMYRLVGKFLDLAPINPPASENAYDLRPGSTIFSALQSSMGRVRTTTNPWALDGPPATHPSAGLSYLRTSAYLDNHPLYGPQKMHPPLEGRVIAPRMPNGAWPARIGVSGFVVDNPFTDQAFVVSSSKPLSIIDPSVYGGSKIPVRIGAAKINAAGRVMVSVAEADPESVLVFNEMRGKHSLYNQLERLYATRNPSRSRRVQSTILGVGAGRRQVISSPQSYGMGQ